MAHLGVLAILLHLTLSVLSLDQAEQNCSYGNNEYLCKNYEVCAEYGLVDEMFLEMMCGAYLDDPNGDSNEEKTTAPEPEFPTEWVTKRVTERITERVTESDITTDFWTTDSGVVTREPYTGYGTDVTVSDNSFTTGTAYTTEDNNDAATEEPASPGLPPKIIAPPVNITVAPGGTGKFDCSAKAATTPQITITNKEQTSRPSPDSFRDVASPSHTSQTTINSIIINNVDYPDEGWYICLACNRYGCAEHDAYLHVKDLCEGVTCQGKKECVGDYEAGEGYSCECPEFCGIEELITKDWVCSNYCEEQFNECQMKADACRNDKFEIEVMNRGRCGQIQDPKIIEAADSVGIKELAEGDELILECNAVGFPQPEIVWYKDDEIVGHGNLLLKNATVEDTGEYTCQAVNCMTTTVNRRLAIVFVTPAPTHPPVIPTTPAPPVPIPTPEPLDDIKLEAPRSTCAVFGDPHFLTFDMNAYSYMGICDNVLAMDCESARWFVYGRMRPCGRSGGSCLEAVTVYIDHEALELQRGWLVNRNGKKIVPKNRPHQDIVVKGQYNNFTLHFDGAILTLSAVLNSVDIGPGVVQEEKIVITWDGYMSVQIQAPAGLRTCGMCGDNDDNPDNDFRTRMRGMTTDPRIFGESWKIDPRKKCAAAQPVKTSEEVCGERYEDVKEECERIFNIAKFKDCLRAGHDTAQWVESCIYDQCEGQLQREELPPKCVVAQAYATRCGSEFWSVDESVPTRNRGITGWEEEAGCPTAEERFEPVLETGCPQPSLEEELAENL